MKSSYMLYISVLKHEELTVLCCSCDNNTILHERTRELT